MPKSPRPYFGGDPSVSSYKFADRLDATDFKEFFDTIINAPIRLTHTYSEFHALPEEKQKLAKAVRFFVPGCFDGERARKKNTEVKSISLVCIDVDEGAHAHSIIENPAFAAEVLDGLNFAIYTTASHTSTSPRCRVVVDADGFDPAHYKHAVSWVAGRLGLPKITSESNVVSQAMFRPTVFRDTDTKKDNPVIIYRTRGGPLTLERFEGSGLLPVSKRDGAAGGGGTSGGDALMDGLEYLTPRLEAITLDDVKEALEHTDPDLDMMGWVKIGMGMRHQFSDQGEEFEEKAFEIFNEWSSRGEKYTSEEDTKYRWEHFASNTTDRVPVTIRTTLMIAKAHGWNSEAVQQKLFSTIQTWMDDCHTFSALVEKGVDKVAGSVLLAKTLQDSLLSHICKVAKEKFDQRIMLATLRKSLKQKLGLIRQVEKEQAEKDKPTPAWAMGLCFVTNTKKIYRLSTGEQVDRDAFDTAYGRELLPSKEQLEQMGEADNLRAKNTPLVRPQDYVMNELQVPVVFDDLYDPTNPDEAFVKRGGVMYVNTYRRTHPEPSTNDKHIAHVGELIERHLTHLITDESERSLIIQFLAYQVQHPGHKIRWAPLIQGAEGCGKGLLVAIMRTALGHEHVNNVAPESIFSAYNDWAYGAQLCVLNEIHNKGQSRYEVENKLKEPIADDQISISEKYRNQRSVKNTTNHILFTNFHDALAVSSSSRRYFVIKSGIQRKEQVEALNESGHFSEMFEMVKKYPSAIRAWFEQVTIDHPAIPDGPPPVTSHLLQMERQTMPEPELIMENLIEEADHPLIQKDILSSTTLLMHINSDMPAKKTNAKYVSNMLINKGWTSVGRLRVGTERHTIWVAHDFDPTGLDIQAILKERSENFTQEDFDILD